MKNALLSAACGRAAGTAAKHTETRAVRVIEAYRQADRFAQRLAKLDSRGIKEQRTAKHARLAAAQQFGKHVHQLNRRSSAVAQDDRDRQRVHTDGRLVRAR